MKGLLGTGLLVAAGMVVVAVQPAAVQQAAGARRADVRVVQGPAITDADADAALAYWTPERMAAAKPMPLLKPDSRRPDLGVAPDSGGRGVRIDPDGSRDTGAASVTPADAYTYPFPYTGRQVENVLYKKYPYKSIGKIFGVMAGSPYSCSGASVVSSPKQVVYTAGHCVTDGAGNWATSLVFVPAYRNNVAPFGSFAASGGPWTLTGWSQGGDESYDMAAFAVKKNSLGQTLQSRVSALGFAYDQGRIWHWDSYGYPGVSPFNGQTLQTCGASWAADDLAGLTPGAQPPMAIGCDMNQGSSGGPWILRDRTGSWLNGLNSYGYSGQIAMYGPYFDGNAESVRCAAQNGAAC
jgi:V8-like Glu-specific endopeptidase